MSFTWLSQDLVESGRVVETNVPPRLVNPLSVPVQANEKKRLILDLRYVNKFLRKMHVKYEDWKQLCLTSRGVHICFPSTWKVATTTLKFLMAIKDILVFPGSIPIPIKWSSMCLQFYLSDYRPPLTCSQKFLSLLRNIEGIKAFASLFFLTTDGVLKRILKCAVL